MEQNHPWDRKAATARINAIAVDKRTTFQLSAHAKERLEGRQLNLATVRQALQEGKVVRVESKLRNGRTTYRYRVRWTDEWGSVDVVVVVPKTPSLIVVTVIRRDGGF